MKFRKKPVVIEAVQWNGDNLDEIKEFVSDNLEEFYEESISVDGDLVKIFSHIEIRTLEGDHICTIGDYIIKGVNGEFYPCKPDIFEKTYNVVKEKRYLHDLSKEELISYIERIQECQLTVEEIDYILNVEGMPDPNVLSKIVKKLHKQKELLKCT